MRRPPGSERASLKVLVVRLLPVVCVSLAAIAYVFHVEGADAYPWRNALPYLLLILLCWLVLRQGAGRWLGGGWRWPLGVAGYAVPAIGLSLYLHYGYSRDLNGMYSDAVYPEELFRYLPAYTLIAGATGFAIGWIMGRNVDG
ncbi:MAG: hypothetical protein R3315_12615 [Woeseiaceae bacterium]|nr:hypothetical protein [Woeseiaceae bacterium]